jgi:hypothetical protein
MAASYSFDLHLGLGQVGLGLFGLRLGPCGLRLGPCLRLGPAAFAGDSRLGCLLTTVSWLRSLNERSCLALDHEAAAQRATVRERSHAGEPRGTRCCPEASSHRGPPSSSALRKA